METKSLLLLAACFVAVQGGVDWGEPCLNEADTDLSCTGTGTECVTVRPCAYGVCACKSDYRMSQNTATGEPYCYPVKDIGTSCTPTYTGNSIPDTCGSGAACNSTTQLCDCNTGTPVTASNGRDCTTSSTSTFTYKLLGETCTYISECNATRFNGYSSYTTSLECAGSPKVCRCKTGFSAYSTGCAKVYGDSCTSTSECLYRQPAPGGSTLNPSDTVRTGLTCRDSKCACVYSDYTWMGGIQGHADRKICMWKDVGEDHLNLGMGDKCLPNSFLQHQGSINFCQEGLSCYNCPHTKDHSEPFMNICAGVAAIHASVLLMLLTALTSLLKH